MDLALAQPIEKRADPALPVPRRLAHVVLYTARYDAMRDWYLAVLNAVVVLERPGKQAFLTFDDEHHRILISHKPDATDRPAEAASVAHVAWTYGTIGELFATYERLKAAGIHPDRTVNHGMTTSLYYTDPDGNRNELQVENYDDPTDAFDLVSGNHYRNFEFDADRVAAALDAGLDEDAIRDQARMKALYADGTI